MKRTLLLSAICLLFTLFSCKTQNGITYDRKEKLNKIYTTESGLKYFFSEFGSGAKPKEGDKVSVHYIGKLTDGKEFDNSYKKGVPISFVLGDGKVIKGLDEGVRLLNVGDKAIITIPPQLGYGSIDIPGMIPSNSTLVFEVELVDFVPASGN